MIKATSAEDYKIYNNFQAVCKKLRDKKFEDRLDKPLAYWALPNDRRLPLAFLGRTLGELLQTPFEDLTNTPGIGQKKIHSLVTLLVRATKNHPPAVADEADGEETPVVNSTNGDFDPSIVSEVLWEEWQSTVKRMNLGYEKLGRLAPSLEELPTVIWHTPLATYLGKSIGEIREIKTHGEKRVRVILHVFHEIHRILSRAPLSEHLAVKLMPQFIVAAERWCGEVLAGSEIPSPQEFRDGLVVPLLNQLEGDAGESVHKLALGRLGVAGAPQSVRTQSRKMGVTRARVYQLLDECSKVMDVRWPEGRWRFKQLAEQFSELHTDEKNLQMFNTARELFFPEKYEFAEAE